VVGLIEKGGIDRESLLVQLREQVTAAGAKLASPNGATPG
jgi:hypothetical protein